MVKMWVFFKGLQPKLVAIVRLENHIEAREVLFDIILPQSGNLTLM